jgi:Peptidase inhibitor I78 family
MWYPFEVCAENCAKMRGLAMPLVGVSVLALAMGKRGCHMLRIIATLSALGLTTACVPNAQSDQPPVACGASALAAFVGQPVAALQAAGLSIGARVIRPGDAITEDYSDTRLNVDLDAADTITRIWCG